jgi:hypothetical protein
MQKERWAEEKANEIRAKREKERIEKETRLLDDKQLKAEAPSLWNDFVAKVRERVESLNSSLHEEALEVQSTTTNEISVTAYHGVGRIRAEFRPQRLELWCSLANTSKEYGFAVIRGQVVLSTGKNVGQTVVPIDGAAEEFINDIIRFL